MENLAKIIEESKEFKMLKHNKEAGFVSHAYLFVCDDGDYLNQFALCFAAVLIGNKQIASGANHPDLNVVSSEKTIGVKDVEDISSDVYVLPYSADYKVYIIYDAANLTEEAQNKLLKTIEEPPKSSLILLLAKTENNILPTIVSRVNKINLTKIDSSVLFRLLVQEGETEANASIYASISGGSIAKAKELINNKDYLNLYSNVLAMLEKVNSSKDILEYAAKFNSPKISINDFFSLTIGVFRDIMLVKANEENLVCFKKDIDKLRRIAGGYSLEAACLAQKQAFKAEYDLAMNANPTCVLDEFLLKMVEVKVRCKK